MKESRVFWNTASENSTWEAWKNFSEYVKMLPGREKGDNLAKAKFLLLCLTIIQPFLSFYIKPELFYTF